MRCPAITAKAVFCCAAALSVNAARAEEVAGVSMPKVASVAGVKLRLNGIGVLKKAIFFKAYVVGLYLEKPTSDAQVAITTEEPKRIVISMLRDVSREMFVQAVEGASCAILAPRCRACAPDSIAWNRRSPPLRKGKCST